MFEAFALQKPPRGAVRKKQGLVKKTRSKQLFMVLLIWIAVFGFGMLGANSAKKFYQLDVHKVHINGDFNQVKKQRVAELVSPYMDGGFFSLQLPPIKAALEQEDWIYSSQVKRQWPSGIAVVITEQTPIAVWNERALLNADGFAFSPGSAELASFRLPRLHGAEGQQKHVMAQFKEIVRVLQPMGLNLERVAVDSAEGMNVQLSDGTELRLGNDDLLKKIQRFQALYAGVLKTDLSRVEYLDLRYQRGVAIRWSEGVPGNEPSVEIAEQNMSYHRGGVI